MATLGRCPAPYAPAGRGSTGDLTTSETAEGPAAFLCGNAAGPSERDVARRRSPRRRRRPVARPRDVRPSYFTVTVLTADVLEAPLADTRTRTLYLPFLAGAFHLSE